MPTSSAPSCYSPRPESEVRDSALYAARVVANYHHRANDVGDAGLSVDERRAHEAHTSAVFGVAWVSQ